MDKLKLKYKLKVLLNPSLWLRNKKTNKEFDTWLWNQMKEGCKPDPHIAYSYTTTFCGKTVWIANIPYADCHLWSHGRTDRYASRATALRFRELLKEVVIHTEEFK